MILAQVVAKLHNCVKRGFWGKTDQCKLCQYIASHHVKIFQNKLCGILHTCTKNHNHMKYSFWDKEWDKFVLSFWTIFCPVPPWFTEGYKVPPEKTQSHLKSQFPPEITLLKSQQNFQTRLKSNFLFTYISNIYFKRFLRWLESS